MAMVQNLEIVAFAWAASTFFSAMDSFSTYRAVKITAEALGKREAEEREASPLQRFLWQRMGYKPALFFGFALQSFLYTVVLAAVYLSGSGFIAIVALTAITALGASIATANFVYYMRCMKLKRRYPKSYKKLIRDIT
ncbi:Uncharacterised protein [uncultured archaeon]|nr:Uncharacterised protein [uncultured archaeon]